MSTGSAAAPQDAAAAFAQYDRNGSGAIEVDELKVGGAEYRLLCACSYRRTHAPSDAGPCPCTPPASLPSLPLSRALPRAPQALLRDLGLLEGRGAADARAFVAAQFAQADRKSRDNALDPAEFAAYYAKAGPD